MDTSSSIDDAMDTAATIAQLTPAQQHIVRLLMAGYSGAEIGRTMGISRQAVWAYMYRARKTLTNACPQRIV